MKIYRGPKTKRFDDDSHILVDEKQLGVSGTWEKDKNIIFNITKDGTEREAVGTIRFSEEDIEKLYFSLIQSRLNAYTKFCEMKAGLESIKNIAMLAPLQEKASGNGLGPNVSEKFEKILDIVKASLE